MLRFTIRELVLVTVIVALGGAWWSDRARIARLHAISLERLRWRQDFLLRTLNQYDFVVEEMESGFVAYPRPKHAPSYGSPATVNRP